MSEPLPIPAPVEKLSPLSRGVLGLLVHFPEKPVREIVGSVMAARSGVRWYGMKGLGVVPGMVCGPFDEFIAERFDPCGFSREMQRAAAVKLREFVEEQEDEKVVLEVDL